jgi:hypothetical protein
MKYIDRRLLFPVVAATAWAQQPSPAAAEAEAALRARAEQFFQLQVEKKYRQGEAFVADDTKDDYYNGNKFSFKNFSIQKIELLDDNTRAKVTLKAKVTLTMPAAGAVDFDAPLTTTWKVEGGEWMWYTEHGPLISTPFGAIRSEPASGAPPRVNMPGAAPDISTMQHLVKIDRNSVALSTATPEENVTVSNDLPGAVDLELSSDHGESFKAQIEKKHLNAGEKTFIHFVSTGESREDKVVQVLVSPFGTQLEIRVTRK